MPTADSVSWPISYMTGNLFGLRSASVYWINSNSNPIGYLHDVTITTSVEISACRRLGALYASLGQIWTVASGLTVISMLS